MTNEQHRKADDVTAGFRRARRRQDRLCEADQVRGRARRFTRRRRQLQPGMQLFALHAADGTPILVTDSREAAIANAWSHELETVSVH